MTKLNLDFYEAYQKREELIKKAKQERNKYYRDMAIGITFTAAIATLMLYLVLR